AWTLARDLASRGEFALAISSAERAASLLSEAPPALRNFQRELATGRQSFSQLVLELHEALNRADWKQVILTSERVLALAPQHAEARKARARAWKSIEPETMASAPHHEPAAAAPQDTPAQRLLLWVDGVGGFLICLNARITLGQATPDAFVDVPI